MLQVQDVQEQHEHEIGDLQRQMAEMRALLAGRRSLSEL